MDQCPWSTDQSKTVKGKREKNKRKEIHMTMFYILSFTFKIDQVSTTINKSCWVLFVCVSV